MNYDLKPAKVASTLRVRGLQGTPEPAQGQPLFRLSKSGESLLTAFGEFPISAFMLAATEPDPLWESAQGICSHMEDDHADTFADFLRTAGREVEKGVTVTMPWVEQDGFFLTIHQDGAEHVWVSFPQPCLSANDVRKTLILMLREARHER